MNIKKFTPVNKFIPNILDIFSASALISSAFFRLEYYEKILFFIILRQMTENFYIKSRVRFLMFTKLGISTFG